MGFWKPWHFIKKHFVLSQKQIERNVNVNILLKLEYSRLPISNATFLNKRVMEL